MSVRVARNLELLHARATRREMVDADVVKGYFDFHTGVEKTRRAASGKIDTRVMRLMNEKTAVIPRTQTL